MAKKDKNSQQNIHYSRTLTSDNLSKAANYVGEYVLKGLGTLGRFLNAGFTSPTYGTTGQVSYARNAEDAKRQRKQSEASEQAIGKAMTWISPLNYGAALWNGHGLDARKGEKEVASWSPAWQAVGRLGELYVGPKGVKVAKAAPKTVVNAAAKAGVKPAKAAVVAREIKQGIKQNTKNGRIEVSDNYFNAPDKWYRITETPEKYGIMEQGKNVTTHDAPKTQGTINGWRSSILNAKVTKGSEGFIKKPSKIELNIRRKNGQAHGNTSQAAKGKLWGGTTSGSRLFPEGVIEGQAPSMINYGIDRTNFVVTPWKEVPNGGRVGFHTGEMPMSNLGWFQKTNKGTYTYEPIVPEKRITYQPMVQQEPSTSLKFFERKPSKISEAEKRGIPKGERNQPKPSFISELNWSPENWFEKTAGRKYKDGSLTQYTNEDIKELNSHIPEYLEIEARSKKNGTWLKTEDGSKWYGDPRSWVQMQSKNLKQHNPEDFWTGIHNSENFQEINSINPEYNGQMWGVYGQKLLSAAKARTYAPNDNLVFHMVSSKKTPTAIYDAQGKPWYDIGGQKIGDQYITGKTTNEIINDNFSKGIGRVKINNVSDTGPNKIKTNSKYSTGDFMLDWETLNSPGVHQNDIILSPGSFRKSLLGNNGAFNYKNKNIYRGLIPLTTGYTLYNLFNQPQQQLQYQKQGGKMNILEFLKNGSGIHIKEKNKGKFTSYCGGKVTDECIQKGKNSSNPAIRKRATFAANARKWKHKKGGIIKAEDGTKTNWWSKIGNGLKNFGESKVGQQIISQGLSTIFGGGNSSNNDISKVAEDFNNSKLESINQQRLQNLEYAKNLLESKSDPNNPNATEGVFKDYVLGQINNMYYGELQRQQRLKEEQLNQYKKDLETNKWMSIVQGAAQEIPSYFSKKQA